LQKIPIGLVLRIGLKIREARQAANMAQKDLALSIGYESATAISLIESGERKISIVDLKQLAKILHKNIKFFLGNNNNEKTDIRYALRANEDLSKTDQEEILRFIEFIKMKHDKLPKR
jgi:transcriptional regulator with XRE-family HTH domain